MFKHGDFSLYTSAEIAAKMGQIDYRSKDRMPVKPDSEEICRKWETTILITKSFYLAKYIFWKNVIYVHNRLFVSILNELMKVKKIFILISTMVNAGSSNL